MLVDSERLGGRAVDVVILERLGWPLTDAEIVERFVGRPHAYMIERDRGAPRRAAARRTGRPSTCRSYEAAFTAELVAVEGIADGARPASRCRRASRRAAPTPSIRRSLELTGLRERFGERIFSAEDVAHGKPAPDVFLYRRRPGWASIRASCVVIEDSVHGVTAARAAGMRVLAYGGGVVPAEQLAGPATTVFGHMRELPDLARLTATVASAMPSFRTGRVVSLLEARPGCSGSRSISGRARSAPTCSAT